MAETPPPVVLVFAGHDPTSGAGLIADSEALASLGAYPATVVTAITIQDSAGLQRYQAVETDLVREQAQAILNDMPVAAIKTGMLGNADNAAVVAELIAAHTHLPLIIDPVLATGGGDPLADADLLQAYREVLIPRALLVTPNSPELVQLTAIDDDIDAAAKAMLARGCRYVLVTGGHDDGTTVVNRLYGNDGLMETITRERLPGDYHGSGCTLAAACAAALAHGLDPVHAVAEASDYTWHSLKHARRLGKGQALPDRLYWTREDE